MRTTHTFIPHPPSLMPSSATLVHRPSPLVLIPLVVSLCLTTPALAAGGVRILVDGRSLTVSSAVTTVRQALAEAGVGLGAEDVVTPTVDAPVPEDGTIRIRRVSYQEGASDTKVPYRTVVRPATRHLRPYHPTVTQAGRTGLKRLTYRAKLVDGLEVARTTVKEEVVREPVHQVVTSRNPAVLSSRGAYGGAKTLVVVATAYDPGPGSCPGTADGRTCNGKRAGYGVIAVDPRMIPLGSKLFVPGYGYGVAADVGGAIKGYRIDLGFNSRSGSFQWGRRRVQITILD